MCLFFLVFFWCSIHKVQRVGLQDFEWFEGEEHWPSLFSSSLFIVLFVCLWPNVKTSHQQTIETLWHSKNIIAAVGKNFIDCKHSKTGYVFWTGSLQRRLVIWSSATWRNTLTPTTRTSWATTTRSAGQETPECDSWSMMSTCEWPASVHVCVHGSWSGSLILVCYCLELNWPVFLKPLRSHKTALQKIFFTVLEWWLLWLLQANKMMWRNNFSDYYHFMPICVITIPWRHHFQIWIIGRLCVLLHWHTFVYKHCF